MSSSESPAPRPESTARRPSQDSLAALADALAERGGPAAEGAAALLAAAGLALVSMAFRAAAGEAPGEGASGRALFQGGRADELDFLRGQALELLDREAQPRAEGVKAAREALRVPLEAMELALAGLRLAAAGAPDADPALRADCASGAATLLCAAEVAGHGLRRRLAPLPKEEAERLRATAVVLRDEAVGRRAEVDAALGAGSGA